MFSQNSSPLEFWEFAPALEKVFFFISFFSFTLRAPNFMKKIKHIFGVTVHTGVIVKKNRS